MRYSIAHLGGAHLRETMRECAAKDVEATLAKAAAYVGIADPAIVPVDGGCVYVYASEADAASDRDGSGEAPVLVASRVEDDDDSADARGDYEYAQERDERPEWMR